MSATPHEDELREFMESIGWKLGGTSGAYVRSGFIAGHPGYGMMSAEAAESLRQAIKRAELEGRIDELDKVGYRGHDDERMAELKAELKNWKEYR